MPFGCSLTSLNLSLTTQCNSTSLHQVLADLSKGDMQAADTLVDEEDDLHLSEDEDDEADKMSLASDLGEEDFEEVEQRQKEIEKKVPKKKK